MRQSGLIIGYRELSKCTIRRVYDQPSESERLVEKV